MTDTFSTTPRPADDFAREPGAVASPLEAPAFEAPPLRQAVRADVAALRERGRGAVAEARSSIEADPLRSTLYALGAGVLIGMLLRR